MDREMCNWVLEFRSDLLMSRVNLILLFLAVASVAFGQDYFSKPDSAGGWRTLKDAAAVRKTAGMDLKKLDQAFEYASRSSQHGGLLVVRHGWLVYERYYGQAVPRPSVPASITACCQWKPVKIRLPEWPFVWKL